MSRELRPRLEIIVFASLSVVLLGSFVYEASPLNGVTWCPWKRVTGFDCAGCGMTRSFCAMSDLRWSDAFALHPAGPMIYIGATIRWLQSIWRIWSRSEAAAQLPPGLIRTYTGVLFTVFVLHMVRTILRWSFPSL